MNQHKQVMILSEDDLNALKQLPARTALHMLDMFFNEETTDEARLRLLGVIRRMCDPNYKDVPGISIVDTTPYDEERVDAYTLLLAKAQNEFRDYVPLRAYARVLARKEANGLITYDETEAMLFPRANYTRMREIPPISAEMVHGSPRPWQQLPR